MIRDDAICGDKTCYRGIYGLGQGYLFKDGPCDAKDCQWPKDMPTRPHFTDGPQHSIVDAGAAALRSKLRGKRMACAWNRLPQHKIDEVCKLYSEGVKMLAIAAETGVCETTIKRYARLNGLRRRSHNPKLSQDKIDLIAKRYREGVKTSSIAVELGISEVTARREKYRMEANR